MLFPPFVSQQFFTAINKHYPATIGGLPYRKTIMYLALGSWKDHEQIRLSMSCKVCAIIEQVSFSHQYVSGTFIEDIKKNLCSDFSVTDYIPGKQTRLVETTGLSDEFMLEVVAEQDRQQTTPKEELIHYFTGQKFHHSIIKKQYQTEKDQAIMVSTKQSDLQKKFMNYLNDLPTNTFSKLITANYTETYNLWRRMEFANQQTKNITKSGLLGIKQFPKPMYHTSETNERLTTTGISLANIKRELRKSLTKGCIEFDFNNCFWTIIAKDWEMPILTKILNEYGTIWNYLGTMFPMNVYKRSIKEALTPLIFGQRWYISKGSLPKLIDKERMFALPVIDELLTTVEGRLAKENSEDAKTKLFDQVSQVELQLMEPFVDYSIDHKDDCAMMIIYQYDGCTFTFSDETKKEYHIKNIVKLVEDHAKKLGYNATVKWEQI